jgi:hypothetical protein
MLENNIIADILQSSFSVAVAVYLLVRMETRLDVLTGAIARLGSSIDLLVAKGGDACGADKGGQGHK